MLSDQITNKNSEVASTDPSSSARIKILLAGGGSGGHFYPVIAVAEALSDLSREIGMEPPILYLMAPDPYDKDLLSKNKIIYKKTSAGKFRLYFSLKNITDVFKTFWGVIKSIWTVFNIYPDVIFGKGGYGSFSALLAGRILRIPIIIHESDSAPGRVNLWAGKFAKRIALSYSEAAGAFPKGNTFWSGQPIRKELLKISKLENTGGKGIIFVLGGSLGSQNINNVLISVLSQLTEKYKIIHQTGENNFSEMKKRSEEALGQSINRDRYKPIAYLQMEAVAASMSIADIIISRAGSTIFEIAAFGKPSIIIPIDETNGNHQKKNAFLYSKSGAAALIEEPNLNSKILTMEINRLMENPTLRESMSRSAKNFFKPDAAKNIAKEILELAKHHK